MANEIGIYGEVTIRQELAKGIYQLILAAGQSLKALIIRKDEAHKTLSTAALKRADEYDSEHLGFPESDGRMSIPLYELNQQNILKLPLQEAKAHFNNIFHLIPEYLRERGILKEKILPDMQTKLADENDKFMKKLSTKSKKDIISSAEDIAQFKKISAILAADDFPLHNQGIMIECPDLVKTIAKALNARGVEINDKNVQELCAHFEEINTHNYEDALKDIRSELERTRPTRIKTLIMQLDTNGKVHDFSLSAENFENMLLTDEVKQAFAKTNMLDFPSPDYYGDKYRELYNALLYKRFGAKIVTNWNNFAPQGETQLHIKALSTEIAAPNNYDDLTNVSYIKGYIQSAYKEPQKYISKLLDSSKIAEHKQAVKEMQKLINEAEKEVKATEKEAADKNDIEFIQKKKRTIPESRKVLNKGLKITADDSKYITDTLLQDRLQNPTANRAMYIVNKRKPDEVIRLTTKYNSLTQQADIVIKSYDASKPLSADNITDLSRDDLADYIDHLKAPVILTAAAYQDFRDKQILEQATSFDQASRPFETKYPELSADQISVMVSNISIEQITDIGVEAVAADIVPTTPEPVVEELIEEEIEVEI